MTWVQVHIKFHLLFQKNIEITARAQNILFKFKNVKLCQWTCYSDLSYL